jgi:hypothetical protein
MPPDLYRQAPPSIEVSSVWESNMDTEKGYVYAFTGDDFHQLKQMSFQHHFHAVAEAGRREYDAWIEEFAKNPDAERTAPRSVVMRVFSVDEQSPLVLQRLRERFPEYVMFFIANRTVHEMFRKSGEFSFLGSIPMTLLPEPPAEILKAEFFAFPQATNAHLWAE